MIAARETRRGGVTLIEVLVAIFVMGIGLICLLTLFPLGAMRMAASFKDERAAQAAINARTVADIKKLRTDPGVVDYFKNPGGQAGSPLPSADPNSPSYPVFVDPTGAAMSGPMLGSNIARVAPSWFDHANPNLMTYFNLMDDVTFQRNYGTPKLYGFGRVERERLYAWAYLLQRPRLGEESVVNVSVCVFQRRPKAGALETKYDSVMSPANNTIALKAAGSADIQPGMWVLDATLKTGNTHAYGNFYRITGTRDGGAGNLVLDLQTPLLGYRDPDPTKNFQGEAVILDKLVEVFDLGPGR
jgi:prepilin-type N-terminal cleavage/methylation domain-containing protein